LHLVKFTRVIVVVLVSEELVKVFHLGLFMFGVHFFHCGMGIKDSVVVTATQLLQQADLDYL
jgi:hypothetical protein